MNPDAVEKRAALQRERSVELATRVRAWLEPLTGAEHVLDAGCGTGAFALAVADLVGSVVGIDADAASLEAARRVAPTNVELRGGDATRLELVDESFDLAGCFRVLHHVATPDRVLAELGRVVRPGGRALVVDQLRGRDPEAAERSDRFERARDSSHARTLSLDEIVELLDRAGFDVMRTAIEVEQREVERFLDLAGLAGDDRARVRRLAPADVYDVEVGWVLARRR